MSYILDALNKSEAQRNGVAEILVAEYSEPLPVTKQVLGARPVIFAAIVVLLLLMLLAVLFLPRSVPSTGVVAMTAENTHALPPPVEAAELVAVATEHRDVIAGDIVRQPVIVAPSGGDKIADSAPLNPPVKNDIDDLYQQRTEALKTDDGIKTSVVVAVTSGRIEKKNKAFSDKELQQMIDQASPAVVVDIDARKNKKPLPPLFSELTWVQKERIPPVEYGAHIYSSRSASGFVILNGSKRFAGDKIGAGLSVEAILVDAVQLNFQGLSFRLPAMTSWNP
ncbi:hypothetical protein SIN8267_01517 [Sinobacterium norvegicum]|uniref:Type II secretion system protein GspB C-terminal domain-containing protein n=1 Tax=Sinobacterium norvegicum TaxID=1641715 RepID=A0ABN8EG52_9GAMM|nr:general secretion pathway protein GspB [Sinobacterium norvegicum]CAH0991413.1 hypothetical protein SIN8267_01517 [Sinobacterium norvegicum]